MMRVVSRIMKCVSHLWTVELLSAVANKHSVLGTPLGGRQGAPERLRRRPRSGPVQAESPARIGPDELS